MHCAGDDDTPPLPEVVATSKYIEYSTWDDTSRLCVDDRLHALDTFVASTAELLALDLPASPIRLVYTPYALKTPETWPCRRRSASGCYKRRDDRNIIYADTVANTHELVHAIDLPRDQPGHYVFIEGIAEYLGSSTRSDMVLADFPAQFKDTVTRHGNAENSYPVSMHYVGTLLERDGIDKLDALRILVDPEIDVAGFAAAHQQVYGEALDDALIAMSSAPVQGRAQPWGCGERPPAVPWPDPALLAATLHGECGDGWTVNGGGPWLERLYALDVPRSGIYRLSIADPPGATVVIQPCPQVPSFTLAGQGVLLAGPHTLSIHAKNLTSGVTFQLEYLGPAPP